MDHKIIKDEIIKILKATNKQNIDSVISFLENGVKGAKFNFFTAPASTIFHGNYEGGLAEHSLNVYKVAMKLKNIMVELNPNLAPQLSDESIAIAALLHDINKSDIYVEEIKNFKNKDGVWEKKRGYGVDYSKFPLGHGEKSVIMLLTLGFPLTRDEMLAIRWHMTAWELPFQSAEAKANLNEARNQCPLLAVLQSADGLASALLEKTV